MKILVAGAGIGGLAAAAALAQAGHDVEVVEQSRVLAEVGAGLQMSPNAMKALGALGAADAVAAAASEPHSLQLRMGDDGSTVFSIPVGEAAVRRYGAPYLHVHRADLLEALRQAAIDAGARIRLDTRVALYRLAGGGVEAGLDTGQVRHVDCLVGADGLHSQVRRQMLDRAGAPRPPRYTGAVAWRALAPADAAPDLPHAAIVWAGAGRHAVTYRVRRGELINFVGVVEDQTWTEEGWVREGDRAELAALFAGWIEPLPAIISAAGGVHRWALFDRDPLPRWTDRSVVLLGDACHPMPPFQAQGAAMALEDAVVLARCLSNGPDDVAASLKKYETIRKPRTTRVLASARSNMQVFHRSGLLAKAATFGPMRLADRFAPGFVRSRQDWIYAHDVTKP